MNFNFNIFYKKSSLDNFRPFHDLVLLCASPQIFCAIYDLNPNQQKNSYLFENKFEGLAAQAI
jgi:hypothetical protein